MSAFAIEFDVLDAVHGGVNLNNLVAVGDDGYGDEVYADVSTGAAYVSEYNSADGQYELFEYSAPSAAPAVDAFDDVEPADAFDPDYDG